MIDIQRNLYPFCIVWTVIPCLSWLFPTIGHTGICSSQGVIHDFMGFCVHKGNMGFGLPMKYVPLEPQSVEQYDEALAETNQYYANRSHNLFDNNCHHHVADVLNRIHYQGRDDWTQVSIWWMCIRYSKYVRVIDVFKVYLPFTVLMAFLVFVWMTLNHK